MASENMNYDCIVIGFGGVGSAALWEAAKKGWKVLGIDRFGPAHTQGSSHGQTRIIRRAYFEHPSYVPLTHRAFDLWEELNKRHRTSPSIKELITQVGLLQIGSSDSEVIRGIQKSADIHGLSIETFTPEEIQRRLPIFKIPENHIGLFEPDAAFLRVELCVAAMINQAVKQGAEIVSDTAVTEWQVDDSGQCSVETEAGTFTGKRLIIVAGSWANSLLPKLDLGLKVLQKQQHWFQLDRVDHKLVNDFPCFLLEQDNGDCFYGFPEIDYLGMKVCEHSGGKLIRDPAEIDRSLNQEELARTEQFMKQHFHFGRSRLVHHSTCMYTVSPDGHFFVDQHPSFENVAFAAGLSGHGFKFAPVLGKHLVDLLEGTCEPEFKFLKIAERL
ncbi:MAG: N-methyl-L-tryptophan oxidase [Mariniblastus sp.]|nr:N-methyl-L-tryptophan oxidase [Mariniblastus sp.]